jgi:hypothetical protein
VLIENAAAQQPSGHDRRLAGVHGLDLSVQLTLHLADRIARPAVAHVISPLLFGAVMVATVVLARRAR